MASSKVITARHFPTPDLAVRSNDPAIVARVQLFSEWQAAVAEQLRCQLIDQGWLQLKLDERVSVLRNVYDQLQWWRYSIAASSSPSSSPPSILHRHTADHFVRPISDGDANYDRLGIVGRLRDGATWDAKRHCYVGGEETPASRIMEQMGQLALAHMQYRAPGQDVLQNWVRPPLDVAPIRGNRLLRGTAARKAADELLERQRSRGNPTEGFDVGGDGELIYAATATLADRTRLRNLAFVLLAGGNTLRAWCHAVYMLYQAPCTKKGSDAINRILAMVVGMLRLDQPPCLTHDIDLRAMVVGQYAFINYLLAAEMDDYGSCE
jgi:hypothetical protein